MRFDWNGFITNARKTTRPHLRELRRLKGKAVSSIKDTYNDHRDRKAGEQAIANIDAQLPTTIAQQQVAIQKYSTKKSVIMAIRHLVI